MSTRSRMGQTILFSLGFLTVAPFSASARPQINTNLAVKGDLWGNPFSSNFSFDEDFSLSGMNMSMSAFGVQTEVGGISADWDQLGLAGRSFQGMKMGVPVGKAKLELIGGSVVLQPDLFKPRDLLEETPYSPIVSSIYGLRASLPLNSVLSLGGAQLFTPGASDSQGKSISTLSLNYQRKKSERLSMEIARSQRGAAWQLSGVTQKGRLQIQGSYRQAALGFSTAGNPGLEDRRNGGALNLQYQLTPSLNFSASSERYTDGRTGYINNDLLALRFSKPKKPKVSLSWRSASRQRSAPGNKSRPQTTVDLMNFRVEHKLGVNRVSFNYNHRNFTSGESSESSTSDSLGVGWSRPLNRQTEMSLTQVLEMDRNSSNEASRTLYTLLGVQHRVGKSGLRLDMGIEYSNRSSKKISSQATSVRAGVNYQMRSGSAIGIQYRTRLDSSGSLSANSTDRLYLSYTHRLGSNSPSSRLKLQERRQLGKVMGRVFEDGNGNGKWDEGEVGVSNVTVLGPDSSKQTDRRGAFLLSDLRAGNYQLQLVSKTLPIELTTMAPTEVNVSVPAGQAAVVEFPVSRTGNASGSIFRDKNRNGIRDEGEEGAADVVVQAEGSEVIAFTDEQGNYNLYGLPPRKWKISANVAAIGEDYENTGSGFAEVTISPNGSSTVAPLGIATKERAVVKGFEKSMDE